MTTAILAAFTALLPLVFKLVIMWLDYKQADDATKKSFLDFVEKAKEYAPNVVKLKEDYEAAVKANLEKIEKENQLNH